MVWDSPNLNELKMMGAIVNPLMQCDERMIAAGLCTRSQFDHGKEELVSRMTQFIAVSRERTKEMMRKQVRVISGVNFPRRIWAIPPSDGCGGVQCFRGDVRREILA